MINLINFINPDFLGHPLLKNWTVSEEAFTVISSDRKSKESWIH